MNSKDKLAKALLELLLTKKFNEISVTQICAKAKVHRTTFYDYFNNSYELLMFVKQNLIDTFREAFKRNAKNFDFLSKDTLLKWLNYIKSHQNQYIAFFKNEIIFGYRDDLNNIFESFFVPSAVKHGVYDENLIRKYAIFYINGIMGIVNDWAEHGFLDDPEKICNVILDIRNNSFENKKSLKSDL